MLVTNNARDFRRIYAHIDIHPGLVVILSALEREDQVRLFDAILTWTEAQPDLVNKLVEISADGGITVLDWAA